jgi:hypothetical protein
MQTSSIREMPPRLWKARHLAATLLVLIALEAANGADPKPVAVNAAYIPADFHGGAYLNVHKLFKHPIFAELDVAQRFPGSVFSTLGVSNIDHIVTAGRFPTDWTEDAIAVQQQAIVVRTRGEMKVADLSKMLFLAVVETVEGVAMYHVGVEAAILPYCAFPDDRTMLCATDQETLVAMLKAREPVDSALAKQLQSIPAERDFAVAGNFEPHRAMLAKLTRETPVPAPFQAVNELPDQVRTLSASVDFSGPNLLEVRIVAYDEDSAGKLKSTIDEYLGLAESLWVLNGRNMLKDLNDEGYEEFSKAFATFAKQFFDGRSVSVRDATVTAAWRRPEAADAVVKEAAAMARSVAEKVQSNTRGVNLRHVGLAVGWYHEKLGHYPRRAICDAAGKPLLIWRVAILPYIDEESAALYKEFRLDEAWDSPHNKKLLPRIPAIYRAANVEAGHTRTLAVVGDDGVFAKGADKPIGDIPDGAAFTAIAVEVGADQSVPWTKPAEFIVDKESPKKNLGKLDVAQGRGFWILGGNAGSIVVAASVDDATLLAMFTRSGGEEIDWDRVHLERMTE